MWPRTQFEYQTVATTGRPAKIRLRKSDGYYYVTRGGKKVRLSKDSREAEKAFHLLRLEDRPKD